MVHYDESYTKDAHSLGRLVWRIVGIACLIAIPGIWIAVHGAVAEARIMGLGLSVVLMGLAGLCFARR
ncbi:MAG: hypothetical protein ACSHXH_11050 [Marivita sp.]|uniref:hypothetical protein n=1 Tax=Marivita sp. TaxID=2003365 RepID=UPI003EF3ED65